MLENDKKLMDLYINNGNSLYTGQINSVNFKFHDSLRIMDQPIYVRNLYIYLFSMLKSSRKSCFVSQSIELKPTCISGSNINFYKAIDFMIEHRVIVKQDSYNSIYYVNPSFKNVMTKKQTEQFLDHCIKYKDEGILSNSTIVQ